MCLAVPGRVLDIGERDGTRMATVDFGGVQKEVCLEYLPDLQVGEYAIVHVGFALQRLDEESARQTLELFAQLGMLQEEFGDPWEQAAAAGGAPWPFADDPADPAGQAGAAPSTETQQAQARQEEVQQ
ncbi:Hydrogenase maturation factor HybG [Streptomyces xanthophaeus]|uniref:HypC/HybG/HupF family hydrogenase formation chaperone n=1 Tax=Streptomyces xanthophaeus TaxID=67385 RepID=UPI00233F71B3|nr:HypC/HybG/HupF family hydrogenase formation chaperone [Streptomyces xanthophaeus]WCD90409.1 Hydrogenase maturation factor HybG [Streptomyces xanthophaeus]